MEQQRYYHRHHPKKPREAVEVKGDKAVLALPVEDWDFPKTSLRC